ncbi:Equilibrative nucleoside transporter 1 [Eumeta japonica]|uniref:Equilibrative nucleoside transporter 1 n=1 Tax=Eumeta variegata TaxID=151549 RepID=A0A4C1UMS2_EUMVA|nr:Equilibrative nucleoside transporter 1 [Eumeta japonica]
MTLCDINKGNFFILGWDAGGEGEKAPFLRNEPVKLTPAWEGTNLPNDTLNLKGIAMDLVPPKDKWKLIYMTLLLHGLGTLTAWNMFITSKDYFVKYKLENAPHYSANFLQYIGFACQIPNLIFSWLNVFVRVGGDLTTRIVWSLSIEVLIFVVTVVLAMVDSSDWPVTFFWVTFVLLFIMNSFNAIFQNCVYGVAARLPPQYTGAVVLGSNICGTLVTLLEWTSSAYTSSYRTGAIYYFIGGMLVLLACFDTYFALPLNRFYRYHDTLQQRSLRAHPTLAATDAAARSEGPRKVPYGTIMGQCWLEYYNVFITFFVTLAIFPAVHSDIKPVTTQLDFLKDNFQRITCFLTFNFMAMIGNITASLWSFATNSLSVDVLIPNSCQSTARSSAVDRDDDTAHTTYPRVLVLQLSPEERCTRLAGVHKLRLALLGVRSLHGMELWPLQFSWDDVCAEAEMRREEDSVGKRYTRTLHQTQAAIQSGRVSKVTHENAAPAGMIAAAFLVTGIVSGITFSRLAPVLIAVSSVRELF